MAITTREGLLRVRGGMVQFRKVDGKFWRDLVGVDTLLELQPGSGGGGGTPPTPAPNSFTAFDLATTTKTVATDDGWVLQGSTQINRYLPTSMSIRDLSGDTQATVTRDLGGNTIGRINYRGPVSITFGADEWTVRSADGAPDYQGPPLWTPNPGEKYYLQLAESSPTSDGTWLGVVKIAPPA